MNLSTVYRAEFYRALVDAGADEDARRAVCRLWGFREESPEKPLPNDFSVVDDKLPPPKKEVDKPSPIAPLEHFPFFRCVHAERVSEEERERSESAAADIEAAAKVTRAKLLERRGSPPKPPPLMRWSRVGPFLRKALSKPQSSRQPDIRKVVRCLAEGKALLRIPTVSKTKWHPRLEVWQDRRDDLAPFWEDADYLKRRIIRERGAAGLKWRVVERDLRAPNGFTLFDPGSLSFDNLLVPRGDAAVLVLSDLGQYFGGSLQEAWLAMGRKCSTAGKTGWVLCPCPNHRWSIPMTRAWKMTQWDRGSRPARQGRGIPPLPEDEKTSMSIFRLLCSTALRVEMGLLRQLRFLVLEGDVGLEHQLFGAKDVMANASGLAFKDAALKALRERLHALSPGMTTECLARVFRHHQYAPVYRHFEVLAWKHWLTDEQWQHAAAHGIVTMAEHGESMDYYRGLLHSMRSRESGVSGEAMEAFLARDLGRLDREACREVVRQVAYVLTHDLGAGEPLPDFIDPEVIRGFLPESQCSPDLFHADGIVIGAERKSGRIATILKDGAGACMVSVGEQNRVIGNAGDHVIGNSDLLAHDGFGIANDLDRAWIKKLTRPTWAHSIWYDRYGLAAQFRVENVPFVMRWIPPGRFMMGSPEDEPGRFHDEGPRHERVIENGFWLGETVVTQAQWLAVMGNNPSHFKGPETLPVEQVSWQDCCDYCEKLVALVPGLAFRLPEEQEWEYACRAGTDTPLWTGGITIKKDFDAPELEDIAWYVGNSWKEPQVENLYDMKSFDWRHPEGGEAGTHPVMEKSANLWGLYDMLGNVWEWCEDVWDEKAYEKQVRGEPAEKGDKDAERVVRGGSWIDHARFCRAAYRFRFGPGIRRGNLGFRLAAGQEPDGSGATPPENRAERDSQPKAARRVRKP